MWRSFRFQVKGCQNVSKKTLLTSPKFHVLKIFHRGKLRLPSSISSIFPMDKVLKGSDSLWSKVFNFFPCYFYMQIPPDELVDITNQPPISTNNVAKGIKITLNKWSSVIYEIAMDWVGNMIKVQRRIQNLVKHQRWSVLNTLLKLASDYWYYHYLRRSYPVVCVQELSCKYFFSILPFPLIQKIFTLAVAYSEPSQISKIKRFAKIVNGFIRLLFSQKAPS